MILIDTNILVYATIPGFPEHQHTRELLSELLAGRVHHCLTWNNIFEYLRVVTHRLLVRLAPLVLDNALENVQALIAQPLISRIDPCPQHLETFTQVCREAYPVQGRKYDQGLNRVRDMWVYTTRGIGVIGPPVRLNCRPEITEITLVRA